MSIRSFIALAIPREMANALGDAAAKMAYQDKSNAVRWVDQANYHITLAFLGEQEEQTLETLAEKTQLRQPSHHETPYQSTADGRTNLPRGSALKRRIAWLRCLSDERPRTNT